MPYFLFLGIDRPNHLQTRLAIREAHRVNLRKGGKNCRFVSGGPLLEAPGAPMKGTLLIFDAVSLADVKAFVESDPYVEADLFLRTEIHAFDWTAGAPAKHPTG
jgi:uncharacterized protein YciI